MMGISREMKEEEEEEDERKEEKREMEIKKHDYFLNFFFFPIHIEQIIIVLFCFLKRSKRRRGKKKKKKMRNLYLSNVFFLFFLFLSLFPLFPLSFFISFFSIPLSFVSSFLSFRDPIFPKNYPLKRKLSTFFLFFSSFFCFFLLFPFFFCFFLVHFFVLPKMFRLGCTFVFQTQKKQGVRGVLGVGMGGGEKRQRMGVREFSSSSFLCDPKVYTRTGDGGISSLFTGLLLLLLLLLLLF